MSVYIMSQQQIASLVAWAEKCNALPADLTPQAAAQMLYTANVRSFNERYRENEPEAFTPAMASSAMTPTEAMHCILRLEYQCDWWSDWEGSAAQGTLKRWAFLAVSKRTPYPAAPRNPTHHPKEGARNV
jgi:hypothetical protein